MTTTDGGHNVMCMVSYLWLNRHHWDALDGPTIAVAAVLAWRWWGRYLRDREELAERRAND